MRNFSRDNRDRGGRDRRDGGFKPRSFDRGGGGRGGDRGDRPMFDAICSNCGKACKVPFRPTGDKPVYCNDCFEDHRDDEGGNFNSFNKGAGNYGEQRFDRDRSESRSNGNSNSSNEQFKELVSTLDKKLDKVIELLTLISEKKTVRVPSKKKVEEMENAPEV